MMKIEETDRQVVDIRKEISQENGFSECNQSGWGVT